MKIVLDHNFAAPSDGAADLAPLAWEELVNMENLLSAWQEFLRGKRGKRGVQEFQLYLMDNILSLHDDLINSAWYHGPYHQFKISDPKPRIIHKATVRDRLLHRAIYRKLYPVFQPTFIADSFSCQTAKGTHKALERFLQFGRKVSKNNTKTCWILKCDIRKFFHSIDQQILMDILKAHIADQKVIALLQEIIDSFDSDRPQTGLPLGNLTSQLFCNVYMNEFDQFVKNQARVKYYIRYADDFVIFSDSKPCLEYLIPVIQEFLRSRLNLTMHPNKVFIKTLSSGMDFLGWVHFFDHRVLRTATKRKMFRKLSDNPTLATVSSYAGLLRHGNSYRLQEKVLKVID